MLKDELKLIREDYTYYVKAHIAAAETDSDVITAAYTFKVVCGAATIETPVLAAVEEFVIDDT